VAEDEDDVAAEDEAAPVATVDVVVAGGRSATVRARATPTVEATLATSAAARAPWAGWRVPDRSRRAAARAARSGDTAADGADGTGGRATGGCSGNGGRLPAEVRDMRDGSLICLHRAQRIWELAVSRRRASQEGA
jgi:hypothetical protein